MLQAILEQTFVQARGKFSIRTVALCRTAYIARVKAINRSRRAQRVTGNLAAGLLKVAQEVIRKGGAASRG